MPPGKPQIDIDIDRFIYLLIYLSVKIHRYVYVYKHTFPVNGYQFFIVGIYLEMHTFAVSDDLL